MFKKVKDVCILGVCEVMKIEGEGEIIDVGIFSVSTFLTFCVTSCLLCAMNVINSVL